MTQEERLAIEAACARLIARYANLNDAADWDGVTALYVEDGRMARPSAPDAWIAGRDAILTAFRARPARKTRHLCTNVVIDVVSDSEAVGTSAVALFAEGQSPTIGSFDDRFRKVGDEWLFAERRGSVAF